MHPIHKSAALGLVGALAIIAGCARPHAESPRCRPRPTQDPNIALLAENDQAPKESPLPKSERPGGSLTGDQAERRYYQDKAETHLERYSQPKDFDLPYCADSRPATQAQR